MAVTVMTRTSDCRRLRYIARCRRIRNTPPAQTHGKAVTTSRTGYQCGPNSGPAFHVETAPAVAARAPIVPRMTTWIIGARGASAAVMYPPRTVNTNRYTLANAKSPSDIASPGGGKMPRACMKASVPTESNAVQMNPATTAPTLRPQSGPA